jgi:hypothetical protein
MTETQAQYVTSRIDPEDTRAGFHSGKHPLDDYFARHALANDREGIGRAYVLRRADDDEPGLPPAYSASCRSALRERRLPKSSPVTHRTAASTKDGWKGG